MKTTELIKTLQLCLETHGDIPVRFMEDENTYDNAGSSCPVEDMTTIVDESGPHYLLLGTAYRIGEMQADEVG